MTATIMAVVGDDRDGYETNYLGSSDSTYSDSGSQQGYQDGHGYEQGGQGKDYYAEPHYAFAYEVHDDHTGDIKAHKEERKGDHTQGMYMLVEPNGSKRVVEYVVQGKSGFNAKVHQSKPQGHTGGHVGHSSYTGGHTSNSGHIGGHTSNSGYIGGHASASGYIRGHASNNGYTGGHVSNSGYTGGQAAQNSFTEGFHTSSLGDYASGHYSHNQSPYKVQENTPNYNYKPSIPYKPTFNLQPFKPLTPYVPSDPKNSNDFPYSKPLVALYRPQTSYKPLSLDKSVSYKFIPAHKQSSYGNLRSQSSQGHATSSVSFASHGSKIASSTNHVVPQQKRYENKH